MLMDVRRLERSTPEESLLRRNDGSENHENDLSRWMDVTSFVLCQGKKWDVLRGGLHRVKTVWRGCSSPGGICAGSLTEKGCPSQGAIHLVTREWRGRHESISARARGRFVTSQLEKVCRIFRWEQTHLGVDSYTFVFSEPNNLPLVYKSFNVHLLSTGLNG